MQKEESDFDSMKVSSYQIIKFEINVFHFYFYQSEHPDIPFFQLSVTPVVTYGKNLLKTSCQLARNTGTAHVHHIFLS